MQSARARRIDSPRSLLVLIAAATGAAGPAFADVDFAARTGSGPIKAAHSGLCLTVPGGTTTNGAQIEQQTCTGSAAQTWQAKPFGNGLILVNQATGQCLDSMLSYNQGNPVIQWTCNASAQQTWAASPQGGGYGLKTAYSGQCADVFGAQTTSGAKLIQWNCSGSANQTFVPVASASTTGGGVAAGTATGTTLTATPTAANGWYAKEMFFFTRAAGGTIASQTTFLSYNFGTTPAGMNTPSGPFAVPAGATWGIGMRVWPNADKSRNGTPSLVYSDTNGQGVLTTSGDCAAGTRTDSWGDAGTKGSNIVYTLTCSAAAGTTAGIGTSPGTGGGTGTTAGTTAPGEPAPTTASILINRRSGNCLDAGNGALTQQICRDLASQNWTFVPTASGYQIKSATTGNCLAVQNADTANGAALVQQGCSTAANALFRLRKLDKWLEIVATHSGRCLSPSGGGDGRDSGRTLVQWDCDTADPQRWTVLGAEGRAPSSWTGVRTIGIVPVAGTVLPNGKLMFWAAEQRDNFSSGVNTWTTLYDPATDQASERNVTQTGSDMFCPGTNVLPDGRVLVTGGITAGFATVYNPATDTWSRVANMNITRGYNASTTLSNGDSFTYGGSWSGGAGGKDAEVWSSASNAWRVLRNVKGNDAADPSVPIYPGDTHYWLFAGPNGSVFHAGPSARMNWITTSGDGSLRSVGTRGSDRFAVNGTATMYDVGKIYKAGGAPAYTGVPAFDTTYTIDITAGPNGTPTVAEAAPMLFARTYMNSVLLPDGDIVTAGGQNVAAQFTDNLPVMMPEIWSPRTGKVRRLAPMAVPRNYHSIGMLLADGRVLFGGGGLCGGCGGANHPNFEILSPPYLFDASGNPASRPSITQMGSNVTLGGTFAVTTDRTVTSFSAVRLSSVTHSTNNDQRRVPLAIASTSGTTYQLAIPGERGTMLPGTWMLFAMDANGVPSVAKTIRIQ
ncbi:Ricin-type beta-trefoil lectin domain-containing protein [Methylobacterium sp. 174MFSha1.1]|nr:Ricin-type beta-trefoil lectin domain-containing protein [Methylobacterium sp. 174MFSha1.1]